MVKFRLSNFILLLISILPMYISFKMVSTSYDDNFYYLKSYQNLSTYSFLSAYEKYKLDTGGSEVVYFIVSYFSSYYITYNIFISTLNFAFLATFYRTLKYYFVNYKIIYLITILTNFYLYVFLSNTHKLKFALIFLMIFLIKKNSKKIWLFFSALTHFQNIIFVVFFQIKSLLNKNIFIIHSKEPLLFKILLSSTFLFTIYYFSEVIFNKFLFYVTISIPYKTFILIIIYVSYLIIFKLKNEINNFLLLGFIIIPIAFLVSGDRINFILVSYISFVELNRSLNKKLFSLVIVIPFIFYSLIRLILYINKGLFIF